MWFVALIAAAFVIAVVWWARRPHHRHTCAVRSGDGHFANQQYIAPGHRRVDPAPPQHAAPGEHDGD